VGACPLEPPQILPWLNYKTGMLCWQNISTEDGSVSVIMSQSQDPSRFPICDWHNLLNSAAFVVGWDSLDCWPSRSGREVPSFERTLMT
jgi:hypothetical protein